MRSFMLDEVVAARDAARGFSGLLERLRTGQERRFVIFFRNRPQAVLLHLAEYERLLEAAEDSGEDVISHGLTGTRHG